MLECMNVKMQNICDKLVWMSKNYKSVWTRLRLLFGDNANDPTQKWIIDYVDPLWIGQNIGLFKAINSNYSAQLVIKSLNCFPN